MFPAQVLDALRDALAKIYWYKRDLRRFFDRCGLPDSVLNRLNWDDYKITVADALVTAIDDLRSDGLRYMRCLIQQVVEFKRFDHLRQLEDGDRKAAEARSAVAKLRELVTQHDSDMVRGTSVRRPSPSEDGTAKARALSEALAALYRRFAALVAIADHQERGRQLEQFLYDLFRAFDLDPKERFQLTEEQIDGAFELDGTQFILEARWRKEPANKTQLDAFESRVRDKLENTLGLFLSMNDFSQAAVDSKTGTQSAIILMTGEDLAAVLEQRIALPDLLRRKKRFASQTGRILLTVRQILGQ